MPKKDLEKRKKARKEDDDLLHLKRSNHLLVQPAHSTHFIQFQNFFAHKVYIAFNEDIKGSSTRPHILGTNGVG